ncbi:unnamed protein product [Arctia plantaginis]|uniref:Uncharacterized protein n=1 Tax=Arctia plantaginis TaxID=874455 RepID=A0A8S1A0M6_ARCPL|nr:unnamed protein product [Arctia plantaginis]
MVKNRCADAALCSKRYHRVHSSAILALIFLRIEDLLLIHSHWCFSISEPCNLMQGMIFICPYGMTCF